MYLQISPDALDAKAILPHRLRVLAAGNESHVCAGRRQAGPELSSDGDRNSYKSLPDAVIRPCPLLATLHEQ
jgi:hypothetical protein